MHVQAGWDILRTQVGGPRARRVAERGNPGERRPDDREVKKGGAAMGEKVRSSAGRLLPTALVAVGWFAFALGHFERSRSVALAFCLLAIARVLPLALQLHAL